MKAKTTRRALLASALSLLLCVSMLVGTTFAWFTDSASVGLNQIVTGNLDVVLEYWDGDSYEEVTSTTKLFSDAALWEPGYTEVAYLKISNAGSLALKYQLGVNVYGEIIGKTKDGADIKLSDHLVFSVVEKQLASEADEYTREGARTAAGSTKGLTSPISSTKTLQPKTAENAADKEDYVALIIYMPETVGNEANHDGVNVPKIEMGVSLFATQATVESDSFDDQYDKGAAWDVVVSTADELLDIAQRINAGESFEGKTVMLGADIDLSNVVWTPIGTGANPFNGTFDGNGKTVTLNKMSGETTTLVDSSDYGYAYGFFGVIGWASDAHENEKVTIKNLKLIVSFETEDAYVMGGLVGADAAGHKGSGRNSSLACDIEISNVTVNGKVISKNEKSGVTIGGIAGKLYTKGNITINDCTNNAEVSAETTSGKDNKVGGILGFYSGANSVVITNNTNNGAVTSKSVNAASSKASGICITGGTTQSVNISNNTNNGGVTGTGNAVVAIAFSGNDSPICMVPEHVTKNNSNSGKLYTIDGTGTATEVLYTFLVYGGKSQTPADNTTDDSRYTGGVVVMEINETE